MLFYDLTLCVFYHTNNRLKRALLIYQVRERPTSFSVSEVEWKQMIEIEGVLNITQVLTKMAQYEKLYTGSYGTLIKRHVYSSLKSRSIKLIDQEAVKEAPRLPRVDADVAAMTYVGATCRNRAILEFERRFMGNTTEETYHGGAQQVLTNDRQLMAMFLDLRTLNYLGDKAVYTRVTALLADEYASFSVQYFKYEREAARRVAANGEPVEADAVVDVPMDVDVTTATPNTASTYLQESSDESEGNSTSSEDVHQSEESMQKADEEVARATFKKKMRKWSKYKVNWKELFPDAQLPDDPKPMEDLLQLDIGIVYRKVIHDDKGRKEFGFCH